MQIKYLDGPRLRRSILAASEYAQQQREELNRINVFPVPDGDTGTNLALTLRAVSDHLGENRDRRVSSVAQEVARAAILGARGNCGMMLSHFLLGFSDRIAEQIRLYPSDFGEALTAGVETLNAALENPVEGTILTVMRDTAQAAAESSTDDFVPLLRSLVQAAQESLERTPNLLPVLRQAGVVDAGAKGFVHLLEGVLLYVEGRTPPPAVVAAEPSTPVAAASFSSGEQQFRYCTEGLVRGEDLPSQEEARSHLREMGDSLIVIRSGDVLKVHIHTDGPEEVFQWMRRAGTLVTHKAEDMRAQHHAVGQAAHRHVSLARRPLAILTDSAADLPEEVVRAHGIEVVPLVLMDGDEVLYDGIDIGADEFHRRLGSASENLPTTSQPAPAAFLEGFRRAAEDGEQVVAVLLGSALSGTFSSAEAAASRFEDAPVHLVDTAGASLLQGFLVLKAAEMAEGGATAEQIVTELDRIRDRSGLLFTVNRFDRLLASGRVGLGRATLGRLLRLKPIFALDRNGRVEAAGKVFGRRRARQACLKELATRVPPGTVGARFGVIHVACPEFVAPVAEQIRALYGSDVEIITRPATPVISTHLGVGAWGIAYLNEG